jgi:hypothetical protein
MGLAFLVMPQPDARFSSQRSATSTVQQRLTAQPVLASPDRVSAPDECVARDGAPQATFADARFFGSLLRSENVHGLILSQRRRSSKKFKKS